MFFDTQSEEEKKASFMFLENFLINNKPCLVSDTSFIICSNGDSAINSISSMELVLRDRQWVINNFISGK